MTFGGGGSEGVQSLEPPGRDSILPSHCALWPVREGRSQTRRSSGASARCSSRPQKNASMSAYFSASRSDGAINTYGLRRAAKTGKSRRPGRRAHTSKRQRLGGISMKARTSSEVCFQDSAELPAGGQMGCVPLRFSSSLRHIILNHQEKPVC